MMLIGLVPIDLDGGSLLTRLLLHHLLVRQQHRANLQPFHYYQGLSYLSLHQVNFDR